MDKKFDYAKAIAELEEIAAKVENPETKLDDIDALVGRSKELLKQCREYLRTVKEKIDSLDKEEAYEKDLRTGPLVDAVQRRH